eukprot:878460-Alexandrium_andersonii.AAC.1
MSASLVGSEMCIRDRLSALARALPPRSGIPGLKHTSHDLFSQCRWTVSYTHLTLPTICSV